MYKIILLFYDELEVIKVKEINWEVLSFIKWRYGHCDLKDILYGDYAEKFEPYYYSDSKEDILKGLERCMGVEESKINNFKRIVDKYFL